MRGTTIDDTKAASGTWMPWEPPAPGPFRLELHRGLSTTRSEWVVVLAARLASWIVLLAISIDLPALVLEPWALLARGAPWKAAIATGLAAVGLSMLFSIAAAIPVAAVYALVRLIGRLPRPWSRAWPLPLVALAWTVVCDVSPHPFARVSPGLSRPFFLALFSTWLISATLLARWRDRRRRALMGAVLAAVALTAFRALPPTIHGEPRDLVWLCTVVSAAAVLYPLSRRLSTRPPRRVACTFGALAVASFAAHLAAWRLCSDYRVYAKDYGHYTARLERFCRALLDFDNDGYSALLGGGDCDDFDATRSPGAIESVGRDANCNGVVRPASSTPAERGLTSPVGDPDLREGTIRRVVLISIDCLRADVVSERVTPNLVRLARRGIRFTKLYAAGSRTNVSLPLMLRGAWKSAPVAEILESRQITTSAIFGGLVEDFVFDGFGSLAQPDPPDGRFPAAEVTDRALADLEQTADRPHLTWAHYYDAHAPLSPAELRPDLPRFPPLRGESAESSAYLTALANIDREVGRLVEGALATVPAEQTVLILTGDHGEGFGLHRVSEHGRSTFEEIIHVPGILVSPVVAPNGSRAYERVVSHRDVAATILGAFGLVAANPSVESFGRSWWRLRASPEASLHTFVTSYSTSSHVSGWHEAPMMARVDEWTKYAVAYREEGERLYHLEEATAEWRDLALDHAAEVARDRLELETYRDLDDPPP